MLNGEPVISIGGQNYSSASNTIILPLNRGDQVWLQLYRGQLVELTDSWSSGAGYVKHMTSTYYFLRRTTLRRKVEIPI